MTSFSGILGIVSIDPGMIFELATSFLDPIDFDAHIDALADIAIIPFYRKGCKVSSFGICPLITRRS
jgi:hypothetical protein